MPQDAFTIKYITEELRARLRGGKISRIIQPSRDELTFIIYTGKRNVKLEACLSAQASRLSLTEDDLPVPASAPNFCMLLRKHLQNAEITDIFQPDFERIICFDLRCVSDFSSSELRLHFEIMGKYSNAVLTENGIIVGALKTTALSDNARRVLFGGVRYAPPEPQDKAAPDDTAAVAEALKNAAGDMAKFISERIKGIAYTTALEMVAEYGDGITAQNVYDYVFTRPASPCITLNGDEPDDFKVRSVKGNCTRYQSVLEAQSAFYSHRRKKREFADKTAKLKNALGAAVKRAEKRLADCEARLADCAGAEDVKLKGELITASIYALRRGMTSFTAANYYDPEGGTVKIELDEALTPSQNAQKYYKRYAKLKRTQINVSARREETLKELDYLKSIEAHICAAEGLVDLEETEDELDALGLIRKPAVRKKNTAPTPYRAYICDGFEIIAGRSNLQNERLTRGLAPEDIWLHTQKYHSSHVGIITGGRDVPDGVIKAAAELCAYYSDGRGGTKIPVDYTRKKFVKKPPKTAAGFVVYTDYETALAEPDAHTELIKNETRE